MRFTIKSATQPTTKQSVSLCELSKGIEEALGETVELGLIGNEAA
jgi:hypothetical protein